VSGVLLLFIKKMLTVDKNIETTNQLKFIKLSITFLSKSYLGLFRLSNKEIIKGISKVKIAVKAN
jgi:hypothetical protein